jgi:hypothetical protein
LCAVKNTSVLCPGRTRTNSCVGWKSQGILSDTSALNHTRISRFAAALSRATSASQQAVHTHVLMRPGNAAGTKQKGAEGLGRRTGGELPTRVLIRYGARCDGYVQHTQALPDSLFDLRVRRVNASLELILDGLGHKRRRGLNKMVSSPSCLATTNNVVVNGAGELDGLECKWLQGGSTALAGWVVAPRQRTG